MPRRGSAGGSSAPIATGADDAAVAVVTATLVPDGAGEDADDVTVAAIDVEAPGEKGAGEGFVAVIAKRTPASTSAKRIVSVGNRLRARGGRSAPVQ